MFQTGTGSGTMSTRQPGARNAQSKSNQKKAHFTNRQSAKEPDVTATHKEIANALIQTGSVDTDRYEDELLKQDDIGMNLLHRIILTLKFEGKKSGKEHIPASKEVLTFVARLVMVKPDLFIQGDGSGNIPILQAAEDRLEILFQVIDLVIPNLVLEELEKPCSVQTQGCPLRSVNKLLLEKFYLDKTGTRLTTARKSGGSGRDEQDEHQQIEASNSTKAIEATRDSSHVCLHSIIDISKLKEKHEEIKKVISQGLALRTKTHWSCLQSLINAKTFDRKLYLDGLPMIPQKSFRLLLQLCPDSLFESAAEDGFSPLQMAIRLYKDDTVDSDHLSLVIGELVKRSPPSIYFEATHAAKNDKGKTVYRLLKELDMKEAKHEETEHQGNDNDDGDYNDKRSGEETDPLQRVDLHREGGEPRTSKSESSRQDSRTKTEELLKRTCIGAPETERALEDKLKFLYWGDAQLVRNIDLNILGESKQLDENYVKYARQRSGMLFETVLASVQLPNWGPKDQHADKSKSPEEKARPVESGMTEAPDPYIGIFDWLWESGVRTIFSVDVDDIGPEPHSNDAIRKCLRRPMSDDIYHDFNVEIFKWKKYDICSETVFAAAPNAKEVYLYSRGNIAVLRGWACSSGLHKMANLERLVIEVYPNTINDYKDCEAYKEDMKSELAKSCPRLEKDHIEVMYPKSDQTVVSSAEDANAQGGNSSPINDSLRPDHWIKQMVPFIQFIHNVIIEEQKRPVVKVAVLDDGASLDILPPNGGKCQSFRVDKRVYWVSPCEHGTEMVACIRKLCPMVRLYIGRLDDSGAAEKQKFTTESCFKALEWARKMGVDIVCMSWTFKKKDDDLDHGETEFLTQLNEAAYKNNIILFASLPDKGAMVEISKYVPVGSDKVIRIGSATMYGEEAKEIKFEDRDFLLPGEEYISSSGESDKGSSYATAYAAGLAALVLYFLRAHEALEDNSYEKGKAKERLKQAASMVGMKKIFKVLSNKSAKDRIPEQGFFMRPYLTFGGSFGASKVERIGYLRSLANKILPLD